MLYVSLLFRTLTFTEFVWITCDRAWLSAPKERSLLESIFVTLRRSAKVLSLSSLQRTKFLPAILITASPSWDLSARFLLSCHPRYNSHRFTLTFSLKFLVSLFFSLVSLHAIGSSLGSACSPKIFWWIRSDNRDASKSGRKHAS